MARVLIIRLDGANDGAICRVHAMTIVELKYACGMHAGDPALNLNKELGRFSVRLSRGRQRCLPPMLCPPTASYDLLRQPREQLRA